MGNIFLYDMYSPNVKTICDPNLNTTCSKKRCHLNGGDCFYTNIEKFAKVFPQLDTSANSSHPDLITEYDEDSQCWVNDLTKELDSYLIYRSTWEDFCCTYIYDFDKEYHIYTKSKTNKKIFCIRFPGVTIGHIEANRDFVITKIELYDDTCFGLPYQGKTKEGKAVKWTGLYAKAIDNVVDYFIGRKITIKEKG